LHRNIYFRLQGKFIYCDALYALRRLTSSYVRSAVKWYCYLVPQQLKTLSICIFSPLNAELNPICHLLALLGAHHILHVSTVRVNYACFLHLHKLHRLEIADIDKSVRGVKYLVFFLCKLYERCIHTAGNTLFDITLSLARPRRKQDNISVRMA